MAQRTDFRFEVVVHDDASADGTQDVIRDYAARYPDIICPIYETENKWTQGGILADIMEARLRGEFVAYCDGDDRWDDPLHLQRSVDILRSRPDVTMVYGAYRTIDDAGRDIVRTGCEQNMRDSRSGDILPFLLMEHNIVQTQSVTLRRSVLLSAIYKGSPNRIDFTIFLSAAALGDVVYRPERDTSYRRVSSGQEGSHGTWVGERCVEAQWYFRRELLHGRVPRYAGADTAALRRAVLRRAVHLATDNERDRGPLCYVVSGSPRLWLAALREWFAIKAANIRHRMFFSRPSVSL